MIENITKIEKQIKIVERIKQLDSDINRLSKLATLVNEGKNLNLELSVETDEPVEKKENVNNIHIVSFSFLGESVIKSTEYKKELFSTLVNEKFSYIVLDIVLKEKIKERELLINKINTL